MKEQSAHVWVPPHGCRGPGGFSVLSGYRSLDPSRIQLDSCWGLSRALPLHMRGEVDYMVPVERGGR